MGRRSGFVGLINQMARAQAKAQRQAIANHNREIREHNRMVRAQERYSRQLDREQKQFEKETRLRYLEDRQQETDDLNELLIEQIIELQNLLEHTLEVDDTIAFDDLRINNDFQPQQLPSNLANPKPKPVKTSFEIKSNITPIGFFERLFHGAYGKGDRLLIQQKRDAENTEKNYQAAIKLWERMEEKRQKSVDVFYAESEIEKQKFINMMMQLNAEVDALEAGYKIGNPDAIVTYNVMVLERSEYPEGFPQDFTVAYSPDSKELIIDYELPDVNIIPKESEFKFVKTKDEIQSKLRKATEIKSLYQEVIASVCLRSLHEVFEADQSNHLASVIFSAYVQTVDKTTGRDSRPYLASVRSTKEQFLEINLRRIDKKACLQKLDARFSSQPDEHTSVKPVFELTMIDGSLAEN